ncbi:transposase [Streptomyces sp. NPDC040724]|uniref:winged helix-turn-helix transcriptional regulator n=1 Tax=Streptomyces sp. NPDC040724 TaxID=3155612 RepID=UPI003404C5C8
MRCWTGCRRGAWTAGSSSHWWPPAEYNGLVEHRRYAEAPPRVDHHLTQAGVALSVPIRAMGTWAARYADTVLASIYRRRNEVERTINRLKNFRALATRFDKRAYVFYGTVTVAAIRLWLRPERSAPFRGPWHPGSAGEAR